MIKKSVLCCLLVLLMVFFSTVTVNADYEPERTVEGDVEPSADVVDQGAFLIGSGLGFSITSKYDIGDKINYTWKYDVTDQNSKYINFSTRFIVIAYRGESAVALDMDNKDNWDARYKDSFDIDKSATHMKVTFNLTDEDIKWGNENYDKKIVSLRPLTCFKSLQSNVEAAYTSYTISGQGTVNGSPSTSGTKKDFYKVIDQKTVEIDGAVAPIVSGTVGTYNSDPTKTTYLDENQELSVKLICSRPTGVSGSGDVEIKAPIPDGMSYVAGSMTATATDGTTVNTDDSTGAPVFTFTDLSVGENVELTYKLKAGTYGGKLDFDVKATLTNLYQKNLTASKSNPYVENPVYTEGQYNTSVDLPVSLKAEPAKVHLYGQKHLLVNGVAADSSIEDNMFSFNIKASEDNAHTATGVPKGAVKVNKGGNIDFNQWTFSNEGMYEYTITEDNGGLSGYTYDTKPVKVAIDVKYDAGTKSLKINSLKVKKGNEASTDNKIYFDNEYVSKTSPTPIPTPNPVPTTPTEPVQNPKIDKGYQVDLYKYPDRTSVNSEAELVYTIKVENSGTKAAKGVFIKDYIPKNTTFVKVNDNLGQHGIYAGREYVSWFIPTLKAGESKVLKFTVKVKVGIDSERGIKNTALYEVTDRNSEPPRGYILNGNKALQSNGTVVKVRSADYSVITGDNTNMLPYIIILAAAAAIICVILSSRKRRKK